MTGTIKKWGNSLGMRLPKAILDQFNLKDGDEVEIIPNENSITIKSKVKKWSLEELMEGMTEDKMTSQYENFGSTKGEQIVYDGDED